jgi:hypothetical protein
VATKKWFGSHQTTIPLVIKTSLVAINQLVSITFGRQLNSWPIGDQKLLVAFRFEE